MAAFVPPEATGDFDTKGPFSPASAIVLVGLHVVALGAVAYEATRLSQITSWTLLVVTLLFIWGPILAVTSTFHRGETHGAFKWAPTPLGKAARFVGLLWGHMALQMPLISWATWHRIHHTLVDRMGDPHTPTRYNKWSERLQKERMTFRGFMWAHCASFFYEFIAPPRNEHYAKLEVEEAGKDNWDERLRLRRHYWVEDLEKDRVLRGFRSAYPAIVAARFVVPALIMGVHGYLTRGGIGGALTGALDGLLIAGVFAAVVVWNVTWCTNSVAHVWGDFLKNPKFRKVTGFARNIWAFFLAMVGENWHNRHHALPSSAAHGWHKREIDITKYVIWIMERLRLIVEVNWAREKRARILAEEARFAALQAKADVSA